MALCNVKDGNIVQAMAQAQANSVDAWSYYQAKSTKQNLAEGMVDQLTIQRDTHAEPDRRRARAARSQDRRLHGQGQAVRRRKGRRSKSRPRASRSSTTGSTSTTTSSTWPRPACRSSIALFGVTALTQKRWLLAIGIVFAVFGHRARRFGVSGLQLTSQFLSQASWARDLRPRHYLEDKRVKIYDTTLRDGTQGEDVSFSVEDKLRIAHALDELGVAYIEGGWPGSNPRDAAFFEAARKEKLVAGQVHRLRIDSPHAA